MIKIITLQNFMAHGHSEITLTSGVTVLTGPNNTGKSAVVEALRCLSENPAQGRAFIRHGAKQATVTVELDDGTELRWHRKKNTAWYDIQRPSPDGEGEPEQFFKMGQGKVPPQVLELLRLQPVDIDEKNKVDVHLGDQRSPIFLIDKPGAQVAHFFAASSEGAHLLAMQDLLKNKVKDAKKEQQTLHLKQQAQTDLLDRLAPLPDIALALEAVEAEEREVAALAAALPALAAMLQHLTQLRRHRTMLAARQETLRDLVPPPALADVKHLAWVLDRRAQLLGWQARIHERRKALEVLRPAPALEPSQPLAGHLAKRASLGRRERFMASRRQAVSPLDEPPALEPVLPLRQHLHHKQRLQRDAQALALRREAIAPMHAPPDMLEVTGPAAAVQAWKSLRTQEQMTIARTTAVHAMAVPPELEPVAPLQAMVISISNRYRQQEQLVARLRHAEAALATKREAIALRLQDIGHCPTCGQDLASETVDTFLEGGHAHE